jgi:hypothetical protein
MSCSESAQFKIVSDIGKSGNTTKKFGRGVTLLTEILSYYERCSEQILAINPVNAAPGCAIFKVCNGWHLKA